MPCFLNYVFGGARIGNRVLLPPLCHCTHSHSQAVCQTREPIWLLLMHVSGDVALVLSRSSFWCHSPHGPLSIGIAKEWRENAGKNQQQRVEWEKEKCVNLSGHLSL